MWPDRSEFEDDRPTTVVLGAGAVENAWPPVLTAIGAANADEGNFMFAAVVTNLRHYWSLDDKMFADQREQALSEYQRVKGAIAHRLSQDAATIRLRPAFDGYVSRFAKNPVTFATTNWDLSLPTWCKAHSIGFDKQHYLHGTIDPVMSSGVPSKTLLLPSEVRNEPYREASGGAFHIGTENFVFTGALLTSTQRLVVYGLSVSPLDAELGFWLSNIASGKIDQIIVINPSAWHVLLRLHLAARTSLGSASRETDILLVYPQCNAEIQGRITLGEADLALQPDAKRVLAYGLWVAAGRPMNTAQENWLEAGRLLGE